MLVCPCTEPWVQVWTERPSAVLPGTVRPGSALAVTEEKGFFQPSFTFTTFYKF